MCAVEWKKLGDVCEFRTGWGFPENEQGKKNEKYPFYKVADMNNSTMFMDVANNYISEDIANKLRCKPAPKGTIIFPKIGATMATNKKRILTMDSCYDNNIMGLIAKSISDKYLYYYISRFELLDFAKGTGAVPSLDTNKLKSFEIPIPSLVKQQEIVSHLDTFTTLISNLESELDMRRKQYEHYRNQLLDFEGVEGVEWKSLGEVCIKTENIKWKNATNDYYYIDLSSVERESNRITEVQSICKDNAPSRAQQIVLRNDILFGTTRPTLKRLCIVPQEYDNQICSTGFCVLRANINVISHRLLYYLLTTMSFYTYVENNQEGAGYPSISNSKIMKYEVPIPSLNTQREIVEKLDAFENLIQSLEQEIKLRKQQYEYYREKLLTFEKE